jgi:ABC-type nitrate/sulfonate/bicarbonate transport system substrate-binding protein
MTKANFQYREAECATCSFLILSIIVLFATGCSHPSSEVVGDKAPAHPESLKMGYRPNALADITPVVVKEAGISRAAVTLDLVSVSSPPDGWNKFKTSEVDALAGMPLVSIFDQLAGSGPKRKFIAYFLQVDLNGEGWVALVGSKRLGISSVSNLAGKTVATLNTDQAKWLMRRILIAAGIPQEKINIVQYNPATPLVGLRNSEHAAIFGLEPALSEAVSEGNVILARGPISHYLYNDRPVPLSASVIATDWVEKHPKAFADFNEVMNEAVKTSKEQPDRVRGFFQKTEYGGLKPEITDVLSLPVMAKPNPSLKQITQQYVNDMARDGVLKGNVDLTPLFPER